MPPSVQVHHDLSDFSVVLEIPVQWGEMDAYGHVNNAQFFRYFESARIEFLDRCGFLKSYEENRIGAILHSTDCRFRSPLLYPDRVQVGGRAVSVGKDRFTMGYRVVSLTQDLIVAEGSGVIVSFDYTRRNKTPLPPEVLDGIRRLGIP